jgi:hypothetical protein
MRPDWDDEGPQELTWDWRDRMLGALLPLDRAYNYRQYDLLVLDALDQGICDTADPRHPLRWFDRDDLREECDAAVAQSPAVRG